MSSTIKIIVFILVCFLGSSAVAYGIFTKKIGPVPATILILAVGPGLAVIAGIGRKMKKW